MLFAESRILYKEKGSSSLDDLVALSLTLGNELNHIKAQTGENPTQEANKSRQQVESLFSEFLANDQLN